MERVRLTLPPIPVVSAAVRRAAERHPGMSESERFDLIYLGGSHLGTLAAMVADGNRTPREAIDDLQWGTDPPPHACTPRIQALVGRLGSEELRMASILGLVSGWLFPTQLSILADGGLKEGSFERIYGRSVDLGEWSALLERLWGLGLCGVADAEAGLPRVEVPPIVSRCLRVHLRRALGGAPPLHELQRDVIRASTGLAQELCRGFDEPDVSGWRSYELKSHVLALLEPTLRRGMQFAVRVGDDRLATSVALLYFHSSPGNELSQLGLALTASLGLDEDAAARDFPRLSGVVSEARAAQASGREEWAVALRHVEAALAAHRSDQPSAFTETTLRVINARACWRLDRREDAERLLAEAAERAEAGELALVASACDDMAQYLHLDRRDGLAMRARVGVGAEPISSQGRAHEAESLGQGERARAYWLEEMRRAELTRDDIAAVFARTELGRACAAEGRTEEAKAWLKGALGQRQRLGLVVAAPLYYLAMAAELEDDLDAAEAWLRDANEAATTEPGTPPTLRGDCIYQLGIVLFKRENRDAARDAWTTALGLYEGLGLLDYAGDTHLGLAQLEAAEGDRKAAARHLRAAREAFGEDRVRLDMLEEVERQLRA